MSVDSKDFIGGELRTRSTLSLAAILVVLWVGCTWAQVTTGTISGLLKDDTGGVLPGAKVVLLNEETGIARTVGTDETGRYSAPSLSVGMYSVTASFTGFQPEVRRGILLTVGQEAIINFTLSVGSTAQALEVIGEVPLVESTTASISALVDEHTIRSLPLNGRSYDQLALLQPGVVLTSPGQTTGSTFNYGSGKRFSVGGQRAVSNSFLLDGTNINDQGNGTPGGAAGTNLGVDTIREFKIFTNSYKAEYGHSTGGIVTAITRSGTNTLHGTLFEYIRNSALDARNFFDVTSSPPPFKRNQFGGVVGGPIHKDKTFFFAGYEGLRQGLGVTRIATVPTLLARQGILPTQTVAVNPASVPYLNLYPLPNGRDFGDGSGEFLSSPKIVTNEDYFMGRVDHQLNNKTSLFARYTFDDDSLNSPLSLPIFFNVSTSRRQYVTLQANSVVGAKGLNNLRFAFNRSNSAFDQPTIPDPGPQLAIVPGQPFGSIQVGAINPTGTPRPITQLGANNGNGLNRWTYNAFEWADDFSYVTGKHAVKVGADIQRVQDNNAKGSSTKGSYTFATFADFLAGRPSNLQVGAPVGVLPYWGLRQSVYGLYAQDDYNVTSRLTLNIGLRWETATDPREVNGRSALLPSPSASSTVISDRFFRIGKKNFEPRIGLAWQLTESDKTVLRVGGGIYHNQILPWAYALQAGMPPFWFTLSATNPSFPDGYQRLTAGSLIRLEPVAPFNKTPVTHQYSVSIQHELNSNTVLQVAYAGNKSNHLSTQREMDTPVPTILPDGRKFYPANAPRRNLAWDGIRYYELNGDSMYNSVTITVRRQLANGFQGQIFYTFSKAMDNASNTSSGDSVRSPNGVLDPEDIGRDWGLSDLDSRHAVVAHFSYALPVRASSTLLRALVSGWTLDGITTFTAGMPFTLRLANSVSRDRASVLVDRPDLKLGASNNPTEGVTAGCSGIPAGQKLGTADRFYDPCSFSLPMAGTYGNLGRNTLIGPGLASVDMALEKSFKLPEARSVIFRAEAFNILNHTNLGLPNTSVLTATGAANPAAGRITDTTTTSRQIQFALRINF